LFGCVLWHLKKEEPSNKIQTKQYIANANNSREIKRKYKYFAKQLKKVGHDCENMIIKDCLKGVAHNL